MVCLQQDFGIIEFAGDPEEITRNLICLDNPPAAAVEQPQIDNGGGEVSSAFEPPSHLGGTLHSFFAFM